MLDLNVWELGGEGIGVPPMCRGALPGQDAGGCQNERARANRYDARSAGVRVLQCLRQFRRRLLRGIAPTRNDDRVSAFQRLNSGICTDAYAAGRVQRPGFPPQTKNVYQASSSGLGRPKTSMAMPNSNVPKPSVATTTTERRASSEALFGRFLTLVGKEAPFWPPDYLPYSIRLVEIMK